MTVDEGMPTGAWTTEKVAGARDRALILLGFASALRPGELAALTLADLEPHPAGLLLHVRRSKTDQEARGQVVAVAPGHHAATCPLAALDAWLHRRGPVPGPVFVALRNRHTPNGESISATAASKIVTRRARAAGLLAAVDPTLERTVDRPLTFAGYANVRLSGRELTPPGLKRCRHLFDKRIIPAFGDRARGDHATCCVVHRSVRVVRIGG